MAWSPIVVLVLLAVANHGDTTPTRIVGGNPTTIDKYPSIVQVDFRNGILWSQSCAANILNTRYLLSAAHCFRGLLFSIRSRRIRAGSSNRNSGGTIYSIDQALNHPSYSSSTADGDISLLRLSTNLVFSDVISAVPIIAQNEKVPDNQPVVHAGWGAISSGGLSSAILRDVTIYTVNREECHRRYQSLSRPSAITENMICAGVLDVGGRDACQGDSGGPLYYGDLLVGIISWGQGCADARYPGVSAAVSSYTNWIEANAV